MVVDCLEATMVIDATANSLVRALPKESRALFGVQVPVFGRPIAAAGSLWESVPQGSAGVDVVTWWYPGGLMRLDPVTGEPLEVLTLNRTQASAVLPFLAGDSLWMSVDATTLLRITLADLAD